MRCPWCESSDLYRRYHDEEWGRPSRDERHLFEMLLLEGAQAGLSWSTILNKREGYRQVFEGFDPARLAAYTDAELETRLGDPRIVRNRLKVYAVRRNAQAYQRLCAGHGSLRDWLWRWVDDQPLVNRPRTLQEVPPRTALSDAISKALQTLGFTFVGSTIVYAWLQATGVVCDHLQDCPWHPDHRP
ncbi:MAG TPA: DNA-3-methyladenine glycosylase I [Nevskiaceae bacterium]|nr:DNA-3-methyladenine glycosylase I [Nevskiaceae bacterium]